MFSFSFIPKMRATLLDLADLVAQRELLQQRMVFHSLASSEYGKLIDQPACNKPENAGLKKILEIDLQYHLAKAIELRLKIKSINKQIGDN